MNGVGGQTTIAKSFEGLLLEIKTQMTVYANNPTGNKELFLERLFFETYLSGLALLTKHHGTILLIDDIYSARYSQSFNAVSYLCFGELSYALAILAVKFSILTQSIEIFVNMAKQVGFEDILKAYSYWHKKFKDADIAGRLYLYS